MLRSFIQTRATSFVRATRSSKVRNVCGTSKLYNSEKEETSETPTESVKEEETLESLKKKVEELESDSKKINDHLLRALADAENVRRISRQDVQNARDFAISKFARNLLDVADNLQRAHESIKIEELHPDRTLEAIKSLHEGVVMTDQQLQKVFQEFNINPVGQVGDRFDPNMHDALFEYEDDTKEPGTIGQLMKRGYLLNSRIIRPAQVGVIKGELMSNKS